MTLNPEVARKAQAEIDTVVGSDRLPQISDRPRMHYTDAILKEVLRWQVPAPMCKRPSYILARLSKLRLNCKLS